LRQVQNARKELGRDITGEQPISVLAEDGGSFCEGLEV
jgi:hypothetical protein